FPLAITGTAGALSHDRTLMLTVSAPDFTLGVPAAMSVPQGQSRSTTITVGSVSGFSSPVGLSVSGAPAGVTATVSPTSVTPPAGSSATATLTFTATTSAQVGTFTVSVSGTAGGAL